MTFVPRERDPDAEYENGPVVAVVAGCLYGLALGTLVAQAGGEPMAAAVATVFGGAVAVAGVTLA